jgi:NADH pyrophosphatase NudC (nudix superfamily)
MLPATVIDPFTFCPRCGRALVDRPASSQHQRHPRRACPDPACGFVQRHNPTPAVGALVEHEGDIVLARNAAWPDGWFALITGYLEAEEAPVAAVEREVREELGLDTLEITPIGNYIFERKNEVMLCYHVVAAGEIRLGAELAEYRRYKPHELKPWPRATGLAVADWMRARGLAFEFEDFPGAAAWLARSGKT